MNIAVAIYGPSRVGKTTVANELGVILNAQVRHCGELVKARATEIGTPVDCLASAEHMLIDDETRCSVAARKDALIVEGRFLREVLAKFEDVFLVELTCSETERIVRSERNASYIAHQDAVSAKLFSELYSGAPAPRGRSISIATDNRSPRDVAEQISRHVQRFAD
jgi:broad-specificity NMP kinase